MQITAHMVRKYAVPMNPIPVFEVDDQLYQGDIGNQQHLANIIKASVAYLDAAASTEKYKTVKENNWVHIQHVLEGKPLPAEGLTKRQKTLIKEVVLAVNAREAAFEALRKVQEETDLVMVLEDKNKNRFE